MEMPLMTPGIDSGRVTFQKATCSLAPRSAAASRSERSSREIVV